MPPRRSPGTCPGSCLVPQPVAGCGRTPAGAHPSADQAQQFRPGVAGRGRGKDWLHGVDLPVVGAVGPSGRRRRSRSGRSCLWGCHSAKSTRPERLTGRIERPPGVQVRGRFVWAQRAVTAYLPAGRSRGMRPGFCPSPQLAVGKCRTPAGARRRPGSAVPPNHGGRAAVVEGVRHGGLPPVEVLRLRLPTHSRGTAFTGRGFAR
jgi:hypothetical protein